MSANDTALEIVTTDGTITGNLRHWSLTDPDTPAFVFRSDDPASSRVVFTRREIFSLAARYAAVLRERGIKPGEIVCNTLPNSPERIVTDLGILVAGAAVLNGVVLLADSSPLLHTLRTANAVAILADPGLTGNALSALSDRLQRRPGQAGDGIQPVQCPEAPGLRQALCVDCGKVGGARPFLEDLRKRDKEFVAEVKPSDLAFVTTTSGSTSFPKLVPRTHASFLEYAANFTDIAALTTRDSKFYCDLALGWAGGSAYSYFSVGQTRVLSDASRPCEDILTSMFRAIREEPCATADIEPLRFDAILARPELWKGRNPPLRVLYSGGQPLRKHHMEAIGTVTESLHNVYGSAEQGHTAVLHIQTGSDVDRYQEGDVGLPMEGFQLKLIDDDGRDVVETGKSGELVVKGPTVFTGYLGVDSSDLFTQDGWYRTSDVAFKDSRGHYHFICRKPHAIRRGGEVVYPGWLEAKLVRCPGIQNVVVVSVPDGTLRHQLCACVVPNPDVPVTTEQVQEFCKSLFVDEEGDVMNAVPRYYVMFNSFPTTTTGKVDRKAIRKSALRKLGVDADVM